MELNVMYDGREVGRLRWGSSVAYFAYSKEWLVDGFSISPRSLPLENRVFKGKMNQFEGMPGVFADSLPNGWGMFTAVKALRARGVDYLGLNPLEKLSFIDEDGLGALYYEPSEADRETVSSLDPDEMCRKCMALIEGEQTDLDDIFRRAGSTGGARPKMDMVLDGEQWIVKFRERYDPADIGRMEYEYNRTARKCGLEVPDFRLMDSDMCDGYFATKRFDRVNGRRVHVISLGGLLEVPRDIPLLDYLSFLQATKYITGSQTEVVKAFRLACFNVLSKNFDDHSGNFSFVYLQDEGRYALSPAYDLTRTPNMSEHHMTCMGNPLPGIDELYGLASEMKISKKVAEEIVLEIEETVSEDLEEWL